jgi:hypothetical protein
LHPKKPRANEAVADRRNAVRTLLGPLISSRIAQDGAAIKRKDKAEACRSPGHALLEFFPVSIETRIMGNRVKIFEEPEFAEPSLFQRRN